jgi:MYND finger
MPRKDGLYFFGLMSFLAEIEAPRLEKKRQAALGERCKPLSWKFPMHLNSETDQRAMVSAIMVDIDRLADEVQQGCYDDLFFRLTGKYITNNDKREIASWKNHIQDDFFVVSHLPREGAVFVQCGHTRDSRNGDDGTMMDGDIHEPRVFIVQGYGDPLKEMLQRRVDNFKERFRSFMDDLEGADICLVHTTLLPFNGGITYAVGIGPSLARHYNTLLDMERATKIAIDAAKWALSSESDIKCYRSLNPEEALNIRRLAKNQTTAEARVPEFVGQHFPADTASSTGTPIKVTQEFWNPMTDHNQPEYHQSLRKVLSGTRPFQLKGCNSGGPTTMLVNDDDACPFHRELDNTTVACFLDCCKSEYLKRTLKAKTKGNDGWVQVCLEPLNISEGHAVLKMMRYFQPEEMLRFGFCEPGRALIVLSQECIPVAKKCLDDMPQFHAISEYEWYYLGLPASYLRIYGVMVFGEVKLNPSSGLLEGKCRSPRRMTVLLHELKEVCDGLKVVSASLESQPLHKVKPNMEMLAKNRALLQIGLRHEVVTADVNKREFEGYRVRCGYCGATERNNGADLMRCACKAAYYCCTEHQKSHWVDHKATCVEIRRKSK